MQVQKPVGQIRLASGVNALVGIWEILAPFILLYSALTVPTINAIIVGIVVTVLAAIRFLGLYAAARPSWINVALGVWLIISPFTLGYLDFPTPTTNDVVVGIVIAILGTWSALTTFDTGAR